ncbi:MAG TPA: N-6 DNA methylase [Brevundimonas sp.]|uniref:HsdM family class I SAM-dependent methyltransferase n=1 Tax=Brevundimonas sp. TaxID=1871086 RepID=UPI002DF0F5A1|nr:N-6 DNA methylase [Brevundimonas sp.]
MIPAPKSSGLRPADLIASLRGFEKASAGRQIATLASLAFLSLPIDDGPDEWRYIRNIAAHKHGQGQLSHRLYDLSSRVERHNSALDGVFTETLTPDALRSGASLTDFILLASSVVEQVGEDWNNFGPWVDAFLSESAVGKSVGEAGTPTAVAQLLARLVQPQPGCAVLDPACGPGEALKEVAALEPTVALFGQEVDGLSVAVCRLRLYLLGQRADIRVGNALWEPAQAPTPDGRFDRIVCDPPHGLIIASSYDEALKRRYSDVSSRRSEAWFLDLCLDRLRPDGRAALLLPMGFLAKRGREAKYRARLVHEGRIEGVIALPGGILPGTDLPTALLVLRGTMSSDRVRFVDASYLLSGGKRASERLTPQHVGELVDLYNTPYDDQRAARVPIGLILEREAELQPRMWIDTPEADAQSTSELYQTALQAEAEAERAKVELERLMTYFKLRL